MCLSACEQFFLIRWQPCAPLLAPRSLVDDDGIAATGANSTDDDEDAADAGWIATGASAIAATGADGGADRDGVSAAFAAAVLRCAACNAAAAAISTGVGTKESVEVVSTLLELRPRR